VSHDVHRALARPPGPFALWRIFTHQPALIRARAILETLRQLGDTGRPLGQGRSKTNNVLVAVATTAPDSSVTTPSVKPTREPAFTTVPVAVSTPLLSLTAGKDAEAWNGDTLYLLNKTDSEFVAWNASAHKVIWVPAGSQARAEILRMHDLFGAPAITAPAVGERK